MTFTAEQKAIFAGGCFWCMQPPFEKLDGVSAVVCGYIGGETVNPSYREVCSGVTGHAEVVEITYDPSKVSYSDLLDTFWRNINPADDGGQFVDRGNQYRSAIFYVDDDQRRLAEESKAQLAASGRFSAPIVTEIVPATRFYPAEEYHQDYYVKEPLRYDSYHHHSGRERFKDKFWNEKK